MVSHPLRFAGVSALLGIILGVIGRTGLWRPGDLLVSHTLQHIEPLWIIDFLQIISLAELALVIAIPLYCCFYIARRQPANLILLVLATASLLLPRLLKSIFGLPCPTNTDVNLMYPFRSLSNVVAGSLHIGLLQSPNVCYPSGHVFNYTLIWGILYKLTSNQAARLCYLLLIACIGISRISLGAHWLTDVLGGYLLGGAWMLFLIHLSGTPNR